MSGTSHISLSELQGRIKSAVEGALPLPVWVAAEISELKVNYSGHCYLELVEKQEQSASGRGRRGGVGDSSVPRAQARAVIWRSQYAMLSAYFEAETGSKLSAGMKILAKVIVFYHELMASRCRLLTSMPPIRWARWSDKSNRPSSNCNKMECGI